MHTVFICLVQVLISDAKKMRTNLTPGRKKTAIRYNYTGTKVKHTWASVHTPQIWHSTPCIMITVSGALGDVV